jgi:STE24 endopeptidase
MRSDQAAGHPLIDPETQEKARCYESIKEILGFLSLTITGAYLAVFHLSGLSAAVASEAVRFAKPVAVFVYLLSFLPLACLLFPISYTRDHLTEVRFGLASQGAKSWLLDQVKASLLVIGLGYPLILLLFHLFVNAPHTWWLFAAGSLLLLQIAALAFFPVLILPIFFKQQPIEDEELLTRVGQLLARESIESKGLFSFNLSAKTRKESAMLAGLWKTRRILLSDTLLKRKHEEILVVLAHEIAHHRRRHVLKRMLLELFTSSILLFAVHRIMMFLPGFFWRFETALASFSLFLLAAGVLSIPIRIGVNAFTRREEREADRIALSLTGDPASFIALMAGLANKNLVVAYPRRYRVLLFYTHPPVGERILRAEKWGG